MQTNKDNILKHNFSLIDQLSNQNEILYKYIQIKQVI